MSFLLILNNNFYSWFSCWSAKKLVFNIEFNQFKKLWSSYLYKFYPSVGPLAWLTLSTQPLLLILTYISNLLFSGKIIEFAVISLISLKKKNEKFFNANFNLVLVVTSIAKHERALAIAIEIFTQYWNIIMKSNLLSSVLVGSTSSQLFGNNCAD